MAASKKLVGIVIVLVAVAILVVASAWLIGSNLRNPGYVHRTPEQGLHPRTEPPFELSSWQGMTGDPKQELGLDYEEVEFSAVDGSTLRAWFIPVADQSKFAVVAVHGGESDRRSFMRHTPMLHRAGYPVLLFDYREHGISDGAERGIAFGWRAHYDVSAAVAYMKVEKQFEKVALIGTSMGAVASILAGARDDSIDVVIAENPYTSAADVLGNSEGFGDLPAWYHELVTFFTRVHFDMLDEADALDVVGQLSPKPLFLLHGTEDRAVHYSQSQRLFDAAGDPKELWILEGAGHTTLFNKAPEEYERRVLGFLAGHL